MLIPLFLPKSLQPRPQNTEGTLQPLNLCPQILSAAEGAREDGEGASALLPSHPTGTVSLPILLAPGQLSSSWPQPNTVSSFCLCCWDPSSRGCVKWHSRGSERAEVAGHLYRLSPLLLPSFLPPPTSPYLTAT